MSTVEQTPELPVHIRIYLADMLTLRLQVPTWVSGYSPAVCQGHSIHYLSHKLSSEDYCSSHPNRVRILFML